MGGVDTNGGSMRRRELILGAAAAAFTPTLAKGQTPPVLAVGQLWSVRSDPPTSAKVIIDRIEDFNGRTAVHVTIIDVPVPADLAIPGPTTAIGHMPFDAEALRASLGTLLGSRTPPAEFEAGYQHWKAARGGVFTISVPAALQVAFSAAPRRQ
jgi:hypothetical protein